MPRVENLGANVDSWYDSPEAKGNGSSTYDVCRQCSYTLHVRPHVFDEELIPYNGDPQGDDGWGGNVEHPAFADEEYDCAVCGKRLTEEDD